ncbi:MAG: Carbohydrate-binding CenC domain protein [Chlorobi bacterium]|nr:Carbohydrate-binding CenC domain protein [Chlorobiota bacterium]
MLRFLRPLTVAFLLLLPMLASSLRGQGIGITSGFPYTIDFADTATSPYLPSIPSGPAGTHGFLKVDRENGNYTFEDGTPARFFGTSVQWSACFPDSVAAIATAAHLRKLGINLVRFEYFDNSYDWGQYASFLDLATGFRSLQPMMTDRMDWFIYQLKKNGIYTYLTLQSARVPRVSDGISAAAADSLLWIDQSLNFLYPSVRATHKMISRLLLDHVNPYTGKAYKADPAIAMLETIDRGSLLTYNRLNYTEYRQGSYGFNWTNTRRLDTLYSAFLKKKYGSTDGLKAAWHLPTPPGGYPTIFKEGSFEGDYSGVWDIGGFGVNVSQILTTTDSVPNGQLALTLRVRNTQPNYGTLYSAYMRQQVPLEFNQVYTLSFRAKCSNPDGRLVIVGSGQDAGLGGGLNVNFNILPYWQTFQQAFIVPVRSSTPFTIVFYYGDKDGDLKIDDVQLRKLDAVGVVNNEAIETATVGRIPINNDANYLVSSRRVEDQSEFYMGLERDYFSDLRNYVRDTIGARQPITGAGSYWASGFMESQVEANADFAASTQGWNYVDGDATNWKLYSNTSPLRIDYPAPIYDFAKSAHRRQPLVVNYSQPFPNRYQAEGGIMIPAYSSLQDWDAVMWDTYDDGNAGSLKFIDSNRYNQIRSNPIYASLFPAISHIFRNHLLAPAQTTINIQHSEEQARIFPRLENAWGAYAIPGGMQGRSMAANRIVTDSSNALTSTQSDDISFTPEIDGEVRSDTREIFWEYKRGSLSLDARAVQGSSGYLVRSGGVTLRNLDINLLSENETATVLWVPLDSGRNLDQGGRSLLVLATRTEPTGWHWQDTMHADTWGAGPMLIEPMKVRLAFKVPDSLNVVRITPIDSTGRVMEQTLRGVRSGNAITVVVDQGAMHATQYSVELYNDPAASVAVTDAAGMLSVAPSIVHDRAYATIALPEGTRNARLELFDALGNNVRLLHAGPMQPSAGAIRIDADELPSGTYMVRLTTEKGTMAVQRITVLH